MWKVDAKRIATVFRDGLGEKWTEFVDALIRTHGEITGVLDREIITNQRHNVADGGVDTEVKVAMVGDRTGLFAAPSCWQYKAEEYKKYTPSKKNKKLLKEIGKPYAVELIKLGYAYRLCLCDSMPPATRTKWVTCLKAERDRINPDAPDPMVVTADDIAPWVSRFKGMLREFFY